MRIKPKFKRTAKDSKQETSMFFLVFIVAFLFNCRLCASSVPQEWLDKVQRFNALLGDNDDGVLSLDGYPSSG